MFLEKGKPHRVLLLAVGTITLVLGVLLFIAPPSIFPDPGWGFQVMRCMQQGHPFNILVNPNPDNIAQSTNDFLSWWSPGQYLIPWLIHLILVINTGKSVAITVFLCSFFGLLGYYKLFKKLGFTPWLSAISIAFIASQNYFILPFVFYPGGEVLIFAFGGWFLYGCFSITKVNWQAMLFLFLAGILGFIAKSSGLWMYAAGLLCVWLNLNVERLNIKNWFKSGVLLAIPAVCSLAVIYHWYLSKGTNPSSAASALVVKAETFTFPLATPLLSGLSIDEMVNGLIYHPDVAILSHTWSIVVVIALAIGSIALMQYVLRRMANRKYSIAFLSFYVVATLFFSYLYLKQATVTFEGRHFRIIGVLAIPGILYLLTKTRTTCVALAIIWIAFLGWEATYFVHGYGVNRVSAKGPSGLAQQGYDQPTITEIATLDGQNPNKAIFVITNPDLGVEIRYNRVITLDIGDMTPEDFGDLSYDGHAGPLFLLMPKSYVDSGMAQKITGCFKGYKQFLVKKLSKDFYLYTGN